MKILHSQITYENPLPQLRSRHAAFPFLAELEDGSLLALHAVRRDGDVMMSHWFAEQGQYKTVATRIRL